MTAGWQIFLSGVALGLSIAAPPGPVNAASASQATRSWRSSWFVLLGAMTADGVFFLLTYYGLIRLIASQDAREALFLAGGCLMVFFGLLAFRSARSKGGRREGRGGGYPYLLGVTIGISNPFQIAWWITVGVGMISTFGLSIVAGFFSGILTWTLLFSGLVRLGSTRYDRVKALIGYLSGVTLVVFGVWFLITAGRAL